MFRTALRTAAPSVRTFTSSTVAKGGHGHGPELTAAVSFFTKTNVLSWLSVFGFAGLIYGESEYKKEHGQSFVMQYFPRLYPGAIWSSRTREEKIAQWEGTLEELEATHTRRQVIFESSQANTTHGGFQANHNSGVSLPIMEYPMGRGAISGGIDAAEVVSKKPQPRSMPDSYYSEPEVVKRDARYGEGYNAKAHKKADHDAFPVEKFPESY